MRNSASMMPWKCGDGSTLMRTFESSDLLEFKPAAAIRQDQPVHRLILRFARKFRAVVITESHVVDFLVHSRSMLLFYTFISVLRVTILHVDE